MVDIAPFRAIRYDGSKSPIERVIAPPYDVISPAQQDELYARHPNNIVRIDLNKQEPGDGELSRYDRSAEIFRGWLASEVMVRDASPAFYVLSQTFKGPDGVERVRTGFFGCARLTKFGEGPIMPHERTLKGPKLDRLRLFRATRTNLSPIFGMYRDPDERVLSVLKSAMKQEPDVTATMDGVVDRMWILDDADKVERIVSALANEKIYIADGHHRYETALAYRDERRSEGAPHDGPHERVMMFVAAVEDPGMVVFPTHRLVHGLSGFAEDQLLAAVDRFFDRTEAPSSWADALAAAGKRGNAYAMVTKSGRWLITAKKDAPWDEVGALPEHPDVRRLDVTILHSVVLEHLLGISREAQATQQNLRYSKDAKEAFASPSNQPDVQVAFLMNPTKVQEVIDVSNAGEVMPQKSTFFYPKIPSGLVLYPLD
jgi:uncharacterized protein (DUF1015 family)